MKFLKRNYPIITILLLGLALRIWGIGFGLPYLLHQDEPIVVNHALGYGLADFNPHFFIIPSFCSYLVFLFYGIFFVSGRIFGIFAGKEDFALQFISCPTIFYLIARLILGIIPSLAAIWLTYLLYKRLFGDKGALFAASVVAFSFLTVVNGHYAYVDNLMVFFSLLTYIYLARMTEEASCRNYCLAGISLGLAAGAKYNAALLFLSFYIAHTIAILTKGLDRKRLIFDKFLWSAILVSILTFILVNPFSILDWRFFWESVATKIRKEYIGWGHHIFYSLAQGIGNEFLAISFAGIIFLFVKERRQKSILFLSFPLFFYVHLAVGSQLFSRYVLVLVPFLACCAAFFIFRILLAFARNKLERRIFILLSILLLFLTLTKAIKADFLFAGMDTRVSAARWIEQNLPTYTKIAFDHTSFRPQIIQTREQIIEKYKIADADQTLGKAKRKRLDFLLKSIGDKKTYETYFLTSEGKKKEQFLSALPALPYDLATLISKGVSYVVINYNRYNSEKSNFIKNLKQKAQIVAQFSPYYDAKIRYPYDNIDNTFMPISCEELFYRYATGPSLVIYKIRSK